MKRLACFVALLPFLVSPASAGILETLQDTVTAPDGNYLTLSLNVGTVLWGLLFVAQTCVNITKGCIRDHTISGWAWILGETFWAMVPSLVLLNGARAVLPALGALVNYLAGSITGHPMLAGGVDAIGVLGVQTAAQLIASATLTLVGPAGLMMGLFYTGVAVVAGGICVVCFFLLALEVVLAYFDALFITSIGAAQVGFGAAENTRGMALQYVAGVSVGVWKCVVIFAYAALVSDVFLALGGEFAHGLGNAATFLITALEIVGFSWVAMTGAKRIARRAEHAFAGSAVVTATDVGAQAARVADNGIRAARLLVGR
jgi:hypothetical protein